MKTLENSEIIEKTILFRADLNVPVVDGKITDYSRIDSIIPSLKKLTERKNKIFIIAHFGRPNGSVVKTLSLSFLCEELRKKLNFSKIHFLNTINDKAVKIKQSQMDYGEICLLENIRFYKEEEETY